MNKEDPFCTPALSVILPTDTCETIAPVLDALRRQTIAARLEVILVTPSAQPMEATARAHAADFLAVRIAECSSLVPLATPRAAGIRAATAPLVFVGETHSFLRHDAAEKLLAAATAGPWAVVTPGFENANPVRLWSWAAFLAAYGRWSACFPAGEIPEAPLYDAVYRRDVLLESGESLEMLLATGDGLPTFLRSRGHRVLFEPTARIEHLNIDIPGAWFHEHFLIGLTIGSRRARQWSWPRRLLYLLGAGLIPFVLFWRAWPGMRAAIRGGRVPRGTLPLVALCFATKVAGEAVGYAGGGGRPHQTEAMTRYEVRRVDFVRNFSRPGTADAAAAPAMMAHG